MDRTDLCLDREGREVKKCSGTYPCPIHCLQHWQVIMGVEPHGGDHECHEPPGHVGACVCWRCGWSSDRPDDPADLDRAAAQWRAYEQGQPA